MAYLEPLDFDLAAEDGGEEQGDRAEDAYGHAFASEDGATDSATGNVVDLTLAEEDRLDVSDGEDESEEDVVCLSDGKRPMDAMEQGQVKRPRHDGFRQMPTFSNDSCQPMTYGQEMSFSLLNKNEVVMSWTGSNAPSPMVVNFVNAMLKTCWPKEMRPLDKNSFVLSLKHYADFLQYLPDRQFAVEVKPIPKQVYNKLLVEAKPLEGIDEKRSKLDKAGEIHLRDRLPSALFDALADFQKVGVYWGAETREGRCLIADEPGLGKTIQAIGVAACYQHEWPLLVISPSSARYHWESEVLHWMQDEGQWGDRTVSPFEVQVLLARNTELRHDVKVCVVSYDLVDKVRPMLDAMNEGAGFRVIIADECHMLKNIQTKRAKAILPMLANATRAILLSGTPALSRPKELWSQLNAVDPKTWNNASTFIKRYCAGNNTNRGMGEDGYKKNHASNTMELHAMLSQTCMIRRLKKDMLRNLPPKTRTVLRCEIEDEFMRGQLADDLCTFVERQSGDAARAFSDGDKSKRKMSALQAVTLQHRLARMKDGERNGTAAAAQSTSASAASSSSTAGATNGDESKSGRELAQERKSLLMKLFKETGIAKVPAIEKYIRERWVNSAGPRPKFLVFAHHHTVLDALETRLFRKHIRYVRIDGRTTARERQNRIDLFQRDPKVRAALLGITAAGVGITLTAASEALFAELFWTPAALLQAEDRCHRIGQLSAVKIRYFVAQNTVDDLLWPLLQEKMKLLGELVEGSSDTSIEVHETLPAAVGKTEDKQIFVELGREDVDRPEGEEEVEVIDEVDIEDPAGASRDLTAAGIAKMGNFVIENGTPLWQPRRHFGAPVRAPAPVVVGDGDVEFAGSSRPPQHPNAMTFEQLQMAQMRQRMGIAGPGNIAILRPKAAAPGVPLLSGAAPPKHHPSQPVLSGGGGGGGGWAGHGGVGQISGSGGGGRGAVVHQQHTQPLGGQLFQSHASLPLASQPPARSQQQAPPPQQDRPQPPPPHSARPPHAVQIEATATAPAPARAPTPDFFAAAAEVLGSDDTEVPDLDMFLAGDEKLVL